MRLVTLETGNQDMIRAVTYGRQSHRSETDSQASPQVQRDTGVSYIGSQAGWRHIEHYEDVGLSGYDPMVYRPDFERMMADAKAKKFDVVVIFMLSRLTRQGAAEAMRIQQELAASGVALVSTQEPFINTADDNPFGVAFFALIAGLAHQESKNKSKFIRAAHAKVRATGSHYTGTVPLGFEADTTIVGGLAVRKLRPGPTSDAELGPTSTAADAVWALIRKSEEGVSDNGVATYMKESGVPTPLGFVEPEKAEKRLAATKRRRKAPGDDSTAVWSDASVRRILNDPRLAGYAAGPLDARTRKRQILRDAEGQPLTPHTGFITPARWHALQKLRSGRRRAERRSRGGGELTLLGSWGIQDCGICGAGTTVSRSDSSYVCNLRRPVGDAPQHTNRVYMREADAVVAQRVWARVAGLDPKDPDDAELLIAAAERFAVQGHDPEASAELAEQEAQLEHVQESKSTLYKDRSEGLYAGAIGDKAFRETLEKYTSHEHRCEMRIEELRSTVEASVRLPLEEWTEDTDGNPFAPGGIWDRWSVAERRAFLSLFVERVTVDPVGTAKGVLRDRSERRIRITWATPRTSEQTSA